jgi:hypothetical protein
MRSFFRRPSWAKRGIEDSAPDFYRRSEHTYADIIAATKEVRERSAIAFASNNQVADGKASQNRPSSSQVGVREGTPSDKLSGVISDQNCSISRDSGSHSVLQEEEELSSHQAQRTRSADKSDTVHNHNISAPDREPVADIQSIGHANQHCNQSSGFAPCMHKGTDNASVDESASEDTPYDNNQTEYKATGHEKSIQDDVIVQILITSEIENTKPLIVHRKASQSLREVRLAWCKRQGLPEEMQLSVFLTWKGRRLFDVTTCKSLGVNNVNNNSDGFPDFHYQSVDDGPRVHMEAVMDDCFTFKQKQQQSRALSATECRTGPDPPAFGSYRRDVMMKIILRCPGIDDFGAKVSQKTPVSQILSTFKDARRIPAEKRVHLLFDGDRLDPNACLLDYDIADQDMVDVLIR